MRRGFPRRGRVLGGLTLAAALVLGLLPTAASAAPDDDDWSVRPVRGGYRVTLHLDERLPVRDALPRLAVDGVPVGLARESPDGRTLTVVTTHPAAADADRVELAWPGRVPGAREATPASVSAARPEPSGPVVRADPAARGRHGITRTDYDFGDTAVPLSGLEDRRAELRAAMWLPSGAPGPRPVVMFLHGRHAPCYDPAGDWNEPLSWPCPRGWRPVPSHRGYDEAARVLASHGYAVVSISANGINAQDAQYSEDGGALARGELVLRHLDLLTRANRGAAPGMSPRLRGRLDLNRVGLMGHSRGGEGVVKAALLNADRLRPHGIRAVLPLAPVDFARGTLPGVPMAVLLPYCDGDVADQQGQHFYDDTRYADRTDRVLRSSLLVMGANHNYFNTEWTPGRSQAPSFDDWWNPDDPTCGADAPTSTRLTAAQQYRVGVSYIAGFFRLVIGHERAFLPLFDGSEGRLASLHATVLAEGQAPSSHRLDVAALDAPSAAVRFSGALRGT